MRWALALAVVLVLAGCGDGSSTGPPDIQFGRDVCDTCHMIISEPRFASAYRDAGGEAFVFDDLSEMLEHIAAAGEAPADDRVWVHDYGTEEWLDAPSAWYVLADVETPMGGGIVAFREETDARQFAGEHDGEVLTWPDVMQQAATG